MPPAIKIRPSYGKDGTHLARLKEAVAKDKRISGALRNQMLGHISALIHDLADADDELRALREQGILNDANEFVTGADSDMA